MEASPFAANVVTHKEGRRASSAHSLFQGARCLRHVGCRASYRRLGVIFLAPLLFLTGCAPGGLADGIGFAADRYRVRDASALRVAGEGHLRFDTALRSDLDDAIALNELDRVQTGGAEVLRRANQLAIRSVDGEIDRMPAEGVRELVKCYGVTVDPVNIPAAREALKETYAAQARSLLDEDVSRLQGTSSMAQARGALAEIRRRIEPEAGDRGKIGRALLAAPLFIPATIGAEMADAESTQREIVADFEHVVEYRFAGSDAGANMDGARTAQELQHAALPELARWYAPVFVQQIDPQANYPTDDDQIGRVRLSGSPQDIEVGVDVSEPVVYWKAMQAKIGDRRYDQLVYVVWYPRRPAMTADDPEAGNIDGVVVRLTLDRHRRPALYEFVRSCGCYHTVWVSEFVEAQARQEFGRPDGRQRYAVQRGDVSRSLFLPALARDDGSNPRRPTVFVSAGYHFVMEISAAAALDPSMTVERRLTYPLEPYEGLTRLPLGDGVASMFGSDGLVHDAGRQEGWLLAGTGMLSAGQPRQLETMKIRMDAYDYDNPRLLEQYLRFPSGF